MRILILSCNTGGGHNACAAAIQEELMSRDVPCDIRDGLNFLSKKASRFISEWHVRLYRRLPKLYGEGYSYVERHAQPIDETSAAYRLLEAGSQRLRACLLSQGYTHVLCTHLFPAMMLSQIQRKDPLPIRTAFVATDYTASPGYESVCVDQVFIPDPSLSGAFMRPDLPAQRIYGSGIPVQRAFHAQPDRRCAKQSLGIDPDHRHLLVMSGSMGCGPVKRTLKRLARCLGEEVEISVICGTNRKLARQLNRRMGDRVNVHIHDFVDHVALFMDSSDLFLTKPGGLSVSEAQAKRLPMVLLQAVEGCETYNLLFCVEHGLAVTADRPHEIAELCAQLIYDDSALSAMRLRMEAVYPGIPARAVCDALLSDKGD